MTGLSTESTPRERIDRIFVLLKRTRRYWKSAAVIGGALVLLSLLVALSTKRIYRSETTVVYRDAVRAGKDFETPGQRAARLGPQLKEIVLSRTKLTAIIEEFGLYPTIVDRSMIEAVDEMQKNISFRVRTGDTFSISFSHEDPALAQQVTARLAEVMIDGYGQDNVSSAVLTYEVLRRDLQAADKLVEDTSRALSRFLSKHPQFTWGLGDNPYSATPAAPGPVGKPNPGAAKPDARPLDPAVARLLQRLSAIDAELRGPGAKPVDNSVPASLLDAEKQRDAAALALSTAEKDLATKLLKVTPAHPDAIAAKSKVEAARISLAAAEKNVSMMRAGALLPPPIAETNPALDPGRRAVLEEERDAITAQLAAMRRNGGARQTTTKSKAAPKEGAAAAAASDEKDTVELETEWQKLRLDLERARDTFRKAQEKERAASLGATAAEREVDEELTVADPAYKPVKPERGRGRVFFAGSFVALFLALGYAGLRVLLCETLFDEGDVETLGEPKLIVSLPHLSESGGTAALVAPPNPAPPNPIRPESGPDESPPESRGPVVETAFVEMDLADVEEVEADPDSEPQAPPISIRAVITPEPSAVPEEPRVIPLGAPPMRRRTSTLPYGSLDEFVASARAEAAAIAEAEAEAVAAAEAEAVAGAAAEAEADAAVEDAFSTPPPDEPAVLSVRTPHVTDFTVLDVPEVEVVGLPFDATHEGSLEVLRGAPPEVLGALRVLRHRLELRRSHEPFVVSVQSPGVGEGKTSVATRLAMTLSEAARARVVLVEGNLARPRLASTLGLRLSEEMGFSAQVRRHMGGRWDPWQVYRIGASLYVLAEPGPEAAFPGALQSTWFPAAMRALKESYDYVVIDGAAVLGSGDANVIEDVSDAVLLVARAGQTTGSALVRAAKQLGDRRLIGVVLNDTIAGKGRAAA